MAELVYFLCIATSTTCAALLLRSFFRSGLRLLLWSGLCFSALAVANGLLFADVVLFPSLDLSLWRSGIILGGLCLLLYGLIWDA